MENFHMVRMWFQEYKMMVRGRNGRSRLNVVCLLAFLHACIMFAKTICRESASSFCCDYYCVVFVVVVVA
jgi:hypothetical protein